MRLFREHIFIRVNKFNFSILPQVTAVREDERDAEQLQQAVDVSPGSGAAGVKNNYISGVESNYRS